MKQRVVFAVIMSFILSLLMTCWITYINLGITSSFLQHWARAFILAWPAAGVVSFVFGPFAQKITAKICA